VANRTDLYVHLVWATWERRPIITSDVEPRLYAVIATKCRELRCRVLAVGGMPDHVHLLVELHPTLSVARLAQEVKGISSHFANSELGLTEVFKWQGGYGAFTLRAADVPVVQKYVSNQKQHHTQTHLNPAWEPDAHPAT
jgi:REP element-mobilizing transposase RayT